MYVALERVRRAFVVACVCTVPLISVSAAAQTPPGEPAPQAQAQEPTPQQLREELERLRKEFESVRDTYGARLTALESKLAQMEGAAPTAAAPPTVPTPTEPPPVQTTPPTAPTPTAAGGEVQVPPGAAGAGGPQGALPVYGNTSALSKIFNPDMAVIGNFTGAAGSNRVDPKPVFELGESELSLQAVVDPYARADFFISFAPEGVEVEEGFVTFTSLPGGILAKVGKLREQIGKANTLHAHVLPWVDQPIVVGQPAWQRRGHFGLRHFRVEARAQSVVLPRGDRRGLPGHCWNVPIARAEPGQLGGSRPRLSRHHRIDQPRCRRVVRARLQRCRARLHDEAVHVRCDRAVSAAPARDLSAFHRPDGTVLEQSRSAAQRRPLVRHGTAAASISSHGGGLRADATTGRSARSIRR